jgi:uncharacterized protein (UPF0548 family)
MRAGADRGSTEGVPRRQSVHKRMSTAARWPAGVLITSWRYMWRTRAVHRWEMTGSTELDAPPALPASLPREEIQLLEDGVGPMIHRMYRARIVGATIGPEELMRTITADLDRIAPSEFATFQKLGGGRSLSVGDEYVVRMPGPWDGPVRVAEVTPRSFRLVTLAGHLEAGQIEFRADRDHRSLGFAIESWARSGDWLSDVLYSHVRISKEVQLHMWTSVLDRVARVAGGHIEGGIVITTRSVGPQADRRPADHDPRVQALTAKSVNFDVEDVSGRGWRRDDMVEPLPHEPSGPPVDGGSWSVARDLMIDYQLADPSVVRAHYRDGAPLEGRDMLLVIRFARVVRIRVGVRVGGVYDETREVDGRPARIFGWSYQTLEGHFEEGRMHYEVWKWLDTGDVHFRLHAFSRPARTGPLWMRLGFRLIGRSRQLRFYREICRRVRRLTEAQLEAELLTTAGARG